VALREEIEEAMQPDRLQKKRKGKAITWADAAKLVCDEPDS